MNIRTHLNRLCQRKNLKGFSLIELLIAMALGLMLMAGVVTMFISNKRIYKEQNEMSRLQENARFTLDILLKDIRMAGYTGCSDDINEVTNDVVGADNGNILDFSNAVEGVDNVVTASSTWLPSTSTDQIASIAAGTDAISIRYIAPSGITVESPFMNTQASALHISTDNGLEQGDIVAVSDCDSADIFQISNNNPNTSGTIAHNTGAAVTPSNDTGDLSKTYYGDAEIVSFVARRYFIGTGAAGSSSLFRQENLTTPAVELIEGVENMQILYGEDTSGNDQVADTYVTATNVNNWTNVVSVRLSILFQTVNDDFPGQVDTKTYRLLDTAAYDPTDDRRRRRTFTATIEIRNRSS